MEKDNSEIILVAEDDPITRYLIKEILESEGYKASLYENGRLLVDEYLKNPGCVWLVITDADMPVMNGFKTMEELIKNNYPGKTIGMSGEQENKQKLIESGADYFLEKPFRAYQLMDFVRGVWKTYQR